MKRKVIIAAIALVLLAALIWVLWANTALMTTVIEVRDRDIPAEFDGFRIAQVSDLHNASFGEGNGRLLALLREAEPDVIAITGDLIDSRRTDVDTALGFVAAAAEIAPVYYVTGNHEARLDFDAIEPRLASAGAVLLRNGSEYIERGGERIQLAGIDDPGFLSGGTAEERAAGELEGLLDPECYSVLLSHRPDLIDVCAEYGADLTLSGHAHGGQVRLPFIGGLFAPNQGLFPKYDAGMYEVSGAKLIVSRGLGASVVPLRFNNRPEVVVAVLKAG